MSNNEKNLITFTSDGLDADDLLVTRLEGRDRISDLFCYELELVSKKAGIDIDKVLESSAHLGIKQGVQMAGSDKRGKRTVQIHGMVAMFEQADKRHDQVNYRAVLVPRMWKLTRNFVSQVYLDSDVPKIIAANLKAAGLEEGTDFEFRLGGDYTVREYVVQYEETDYDFICRWMEHEGIWFFFEQHPDGEKLVLADSAANYRDIVGNPELAYRPQIAGDNARGEVRETDSASDDWFAEEVITSVTARKEIIPKEVKLKDYNWRNPADPLEGTAPAAEKGVGTFYEYNDHYKTKAEGDALAKVRAGEWQSREFRFRGSSDCRSFQAGATFSLNDHYRPDFNQRYLLVEVEHVATQSVSLASTSEGGAGSTTGTYRNRYVAIPADRDFRPERRTAWPSIKGVIHAMVEASGDDKLADLNDDGAYRVRLPWDIANADKGKGQASRWIRMAQQYSGPGYGSHFPLHAGTEVLLTHIDGDPDRPIISATVPNRNNPSPVNKKNKGKNVVRSASGNMIEMDDNEGSEGMVFMNGAGTVVKAWRNKAAGGTGGAGGVTQPKGKAMTPDDVTAMVTPLLAMGADQLSPRVGLFSGPMANASLDAGDMVPDLMKLAADAGGAGFDAGAFADAMRSMTQRSADGGNGVDAGAFADVMRSMTQRSPDGGRAGGNSSQKSSPAGGGTASEAPAPIRPAPEPER
ncbi:MAG: type VI secretion system Vgr family protein, partial [Planctomycetota bacterium]